MQAERWYELKLAAGGSAEWTGRDEIDAARRYVDAHRNAEVIATRLAEREVRGVFVLGDARSIIG